MIWRQLRKKTWIDWVKIVVAIDVAGVGIGLILGFDMHVFANIFGFVSRVIFGILYVFVAVLIFKRIFPQELAEDENVDAEQMDEDIVETTNSVKKAAKKIVQTADAITEKAHEHIDNILDKSEDFISKRRDEVKDEVKKLTKD